MKKAKGFLKKGLSVCLACSFLIGHVLPAGATEEVTGDDFLNTVEESLLEDGSILPSEEETQNGSDVAESILEIVEASAQLELAEREDVERLQEYISETQDAYVELPAEEQEALSESVEILENAAVSAETLLDAMIQYEETGEIVIEQTGRANSWRYINGERIDDALDTIAEEAEVVAEIVAENEAAEDPGEGPETADESGVSEQAEDPAEEVDEADHDSNGGTDSSIPESTSEENTEKEETDDGNGAEETGTSDEPVLPEGSADTTEENTLTPEEENTSDPTVPGKDLSDKEGNGGEDNGTTDAAAAMTGKEVAQFASLDTASEKGGTLVFYEPAGKKKKGIDISRYQGTIDWAKVKADGVKFAIIQCGYGYDLKSQDDYMWERNVSECERLGIPYGVYIYSYATTDAMIDSEVSHTLRLLKGHTPSLPVYLDTEENSMRALGAAKLSSMALRYCKKIRKAGYQAGVYASRSWWQSYLGTFAADNNYYHWVAEWSNVCRYENRFELWQYSSKGHVKGIGDGVTTDVDMNYWYGNYPNGTYPPVTPTPTPTPELTPIPVKDPDVDLKTDETEQLKPFRGKEKLEKYTGIAKKGNNWYYIKNGVIDYSYTGIARNAVDGNWLRIEKGKVNWKYTGVAERPETEKWYYLRGGVVDFAYTGIGKYPKNGKWYRIRKGRIDWSFTGMAKRPETGKTYYIKKGRVCSNYTGVAKNPKNSKWYRVEKGRVNLKYTGLAYRKENKKYYYMKNGVWKKNYTGVAKYPKNGKWYRVKKGVMDKTFTGLAYRPENKKWYYLQNGVFRKDYTGVARNPATNDACFVRNGFVDWSYSGYAWDRAGYQYYVSGGIAYYAG